MTNKEMVERVHEITDTLEAVEKFFEAADKTVEGVKVSMGSAKGFSRIINKTIGDILKIVCRAVNEWK